MVKMEAGAGREPLWFKITEAATEGGRKEEEGSDAPITDAGYFVPPPGLAGQPPTNLLLAVRVCRGVWRLHRAGWWSATLTRAIAGDHCWPWGWV